MKMNKFLPFGLLILWLMSPIVQAAAPQTLDSIAAVVNKKIIMQSDVTRREQLLRHQAAASAQKLPAPSAIQKMAIKQLIDEQLVVQRGNAMGIQVTAKAVDQAIARIAKQNKLSVAELLSKVTREGLAKKAYKQILHQQILLGKVAQAMIGATLHVTETEVNKLLAKARAAQAFEYHVLDVILDAKQAKSINKIKNQLQHSDKITHSVDLGWRELDALPEMFVGDLKSAKKGQVIGPITAPNGQHVLKLLGIRNRGGRPSLTKQQAQQIVYQQKFMEAQAKFIKELHKTAYIKILLK